MTRSPTSPHLNAAIINRGVDTGDTAYIWRAGGLMAAGRVAQGICACHLPSRTLKTPSRLPQYQTFH
ncbi:hypothetical protein CWT12_01140 [Actinomyces sp. 432]|uniref:hypothetical protein n=1 Tax=Actinomyces sp. 432 TaxID=2057798 RepID=UPI00137462A2|nr:hypothetical protein [Actinomyces sp. 432]QHO90216.1 hypothetical protein CWT12_01140 [Actinomyces sp. 432]